MRFVFFALVGVQACGSQFRESASTRDSIDVAVPDSVVEFYRTVADEYDTERRAIRSAAGRQIVRAPGTLRITARNGRLRSLVDTIVDGGRHLRHVFIKFVPRLDAHVIREQYYEGGAYLLLSDSTGRDTLLASIPLLSPDSRRFAIASLDLDAFYHPNTLEVWRATADSVVREFQVDGGETWGPDSVVWITPDTLRFVRVTRNPGEYTDLYSPHSLVRRDSSWVIEPPIP